MSFRTKQIAVNETESLWIPATLMMRNHPCSLSQECWLPFTVWRPL